ncbi:hypothetical protein cyc_03626 [Cyclospora cayetanensis]|uniref:Uncharacterized protein n=1 Tax=Cyclospora cayetanensis TaxID=88456 RepID=A0A1D3D9S1_9EIME|nr:hypothetical protein cyc_03626 [Cyclospora cayetanensis]
MATLGPRLPPAASPATDTLTPRPPVRSCNMMFDKRILRGVPFKLLKEQESPLASSSSVFSRDKLMRAQRTSAQASLLKQKQKHQRQPQQRTMRGATVVPSFPVDGGKEIGLQTDPHIVTLTAVTKEADASAQTDAIRDRPMSPLLALRAELVDAHTQIQDGELFNFDEEVVPVLEVLIGRVIEQSLSEVVQEEELTAIQQQQLRFVGLSLCYYLPAKARRVAEAAAHVKLEQFAAQKRDAVAFAKKLLKGSDAALLEELREEGLFLAPSTVSCRCEGIFQTDMCGYYIWRAGTADRVANAALSPVVAVMSDLVTARQRQALAHAEKKKKQVEAFDNRIAQRRREAEERRLMKGVDTLEATREMERMEKEREALENAMLANEDHNVLLLPNDEEEELHTEQASQEAQQTEEHSKLEE